MFKRKPKHHGNELFTVGIDGDFEAIHSSRDDQFFEEAFSNAGSSALSENRTFVGSIIDRKRIFFFSFIALLVGGIFLTKAGMMQIVHGKEHRLEAESNRIRQITLPAHRGIIYDRNGVVLAENLPAFQITTSAAQLPAKDEEIRELFTRISEITGQSSSDMYVNLNSAGSRTEQVLLAEFIEYDAALTLMARSDEFPGINIETVSKRSYITNEIPSLSHILGYTGIINAEEFAELSDEGYRRVDYLGKQGIEYQYETELRGLFGQQTVEVDALGRIERIISKQDPVDGENITLTIDSALQQEIERSLVTRMEGTAAQRASVIVMNPHTGEVYGLVSWPAFDANAFTEGIDHETYSALINDENVPLYQRAISGEFPSGSTIKPVFAAAALKEGIITKTTTFLSTGGIGIGVWFFPDWRTGGHGVTDVYHAIADSVNTFFYMIGGGYEDFDGLGIERLMDYAAQFGFGSATGIDLPGERTGFLPSMEWKLETKGEVWYIGDTYHAAIGQGDFLATPLQVAQSTAIFANDGILVSPHVNTHIQGEERPIIDAEIATIIQDAMRETVTNGSATSLQSVAVPVAGKTGTAQWASNRPNHSWFTGFAPYEDPEIVVTVLVEEGADAGLAIPVARDIFNWWFNPERD